MFWMGAMTAFAIVFLLAYLALRTGYGILNIMPPVAENMIVMVFSVLGVAKSVLELAKGHRQR